MRKKNQIHTCPSVQDPGEKLIAELADHIPVVMYIKDRRGRLIWVNRAHGRGLGLEPEKVIGKTDFDIFPRKRAVLMAQDDRYCMRTGKPIIDKIERGTRPDGVDNYVSTTKIPRFDPKGRVIGLMGVTRDITHRIQLERLQQEKKHIRKKLFLLQDLSRSKSEFISVVSHELRVPLTIVKESLSLIIDGSKGPVAAGQISLLVRAQAHIEHIAKMTEELLDLSRIERGVFRLRYSLVNLSDLVRDIGGSFRGLAAEKRISLKCALPPEEVNIFIDPDRTDQVLTNLLDNALKFTEQGGSIEVRLKILESKVRIEVCDTGIGIAQQDLVRIFARNVQLPVKVRGIRNKGVGFGLAIAKELVERHGGEIWAESAPGEGSTFYFTLPRFYSSGSLDQRMRFKINELLDQDVSVHLINLLIVNYRDFRRLIKKEGPELVKGLKAIISATIDVFRRRHHKKSDILIGEFANGECTVIFPEAQESEISGLCRLLKERISRFLQAHKVEDSFINVGVLEFMYKAKHFKSSVSPVSIYVKKIFIGAEKRRYKRYACQVLVEPITLDGTAGSSYTLDMSRQGLCFISSRQLKTDSYMRIKLKLPGFGPALVLKGRVAWLRMMDRADKGKGVCYKTGIEFVDMKPSEKSAVGKFISSVSRRDVSGQTGSQGKGILYEQNAHPDRG